MSMHFIVHAAADARERAIKEAIAAGKTSAEAEQEGRVAEKESWDRSAACGLRPLKWAAAGAVVGTAVPVVGTAVGAFVGYVGGTISALVSPGKGNDLPNAAKSFFKDIFG